MKISIVIRTLNEKESLQQLLNFLNQQDYSGEREIIIVDNESTDGTREFIQNQGIKLVTIKKGEFTYPKSMNAGCMVATGDLILLTVGHALPKDSHWLAAGASHFTKPKVAGVYSCCLPGIKATWVEKIAYNFNYYKAKLNNPKIVHKFEIGILGATNCLIRKNLWNQHHFDERYELGGEDGEWAKWALAQGYSIVRDCNFAVRHSHSLGLIGWIKANQYWRQLKHPTTFNREKLNFRKDINFK